MTQFPQLAYSTDRAADLGVKNKILSTLLWSGAAIVFLMVLTGIVAIFLPLIFMGAGAIIILLLLISINALVRGMRLRRAYTALAYVEQATRLNMPLTTLLLSAARSERGVLSERLTLLAQCLQNGFTVASALGRSLPEMPAALISEIEAGEAAGRLAPTLHRLMEERRRKFSTSTDETIFGLFYPMFVLMALVVVLLLFVVRVLPAFHEIFRDFHTEMPRPTQILMGLTGDLGVSLGIVGIVFFVCLFIIILGKMLRRLFIPRELPDISRPLVDSLRWHIPFLGPILRETELARVCLFLSEAIAQGMTLVAALQLAERIPQITPMRRQLARWRAALLQGASITDAASAARFPSAMVDLLRPAEFTSSVGEALAFLSRYYRWRVDRRKVLLIAALRPAIVLIVGCLVGFFVVALFAPLVKLLDANIGWPGAL